MSGRKGDWVQTFTGRKFWPIDPRPDEVHIEDIAHALSLKCRWGGHCSAFYSVAEHSVMVAGLLPRTDALWGLLHDAGEAYLADVPRPVKPFLLGFSGMEERVMRAVAARFGLSWPEPSSVGVADMVLLKTEARDLMMDGLEGREWPSVVIPRPEPTACWPPAVAEHQFLEAFSRYKDFG